MNKELLEELIGFLVSIPLLVKICELFCKCEWLVEGFERFLGL